MKNCNDSSPAMAREELALRKIKEVTARYLDSSRPLAEKSPSEGFALIKIVHDVAREGLGETSRGQEAAVACTTCGTPHGRGDPRNGAPEERCEACEAARVAETNRIAEHYEKHTDECCCHTYLGRACCMAPIHGDLYRAECIENGDRFYTDFRAKGRKEAEELGQEIATEWGGECISVRKLPPERPA
jgi:hypothetical protein